MSAVLRGAKADQRAQDLAPVIEEVRAAGASSLRQLARGLNDRGLTTARGNAWTAAQVQRLLARIADVA
jgi:hypothetical protein